MYGFTRIFIFIRVNLRLSVYCFQGSPQATISTFDWGLLTVDYFQNIPNVVTTGTSGQRCP
jgi:hypothetical protein